MESELGNEGLPDLLEGTLGAAMRDRQTVTSDSLPTAALLEGMSVRHLTTHVDDRGSLVELMDSRWGQPDPLVSAYSFTVRPGVAKGWALHKEHEDRYANLSGEAEVLLYDVRPSSSTLGQLCRVRMSEYDRCVVNVPIHVWHATRNLGSDDFVAINFPTRPFIHDHPDKYRLPLDTPLIPFSFGATPGW